MNRGGMDSVNDTCYRPIHPAPSGISMAAAPPRLPVMSAVVKIAVGLFLTLFFVGGLLTFFGLMLGGKAPDSSVVVSSAAAPVKMAANLVYADDQRDLERPKGLPSKARLVVTNPDTSTDAKFAALAQSKIDGLSALRARNLTFIINVIGWRRRASLKRLVKSLEAARYHGFTTRLHFHLDGEAHELVKEWVEEYSWPHGRTLMNIHTQRNGLESTIVNSWDARKDDQFAFFFEDDIEVSPEYFEYAMLCLQRYIFPTADGPKADSYYANHLVGIALNTPRFNEIVFPPYRWVPQHEIGQKSLHFLFQLANSWGCLYFPWAWREYRKYHAWRASAGLPSLHKVIPEGGVWIHNWERSWKKSLIELMYIRGYYMVYPNLPGQHAFSLHHREKGEHTAAEGEEPMVDGLGDLYLDYFTVPLASDRAVINRLFATMPPLTELPVVNFHHKAVNDVHELVNLHTLDYLEPFGFSLDAYSPNPGCILDAINPFDPPADEEGKESSKKYLLMLGGENTSPFDQLIGLQSAFAHARQLNRTLILSPLTFHDVNAKRDQLIILDWFFDMKALRTAAWAPFVTWSDFSPEAIWINRIVDLPHSQVAVKSNFTTGRDVVLRKNGIVPLAEVKLARTIGTDKEIRSNYATCHDQFLAFRSPAPFHYHADPQLESEFREWSLQSLRLKEKFQKTFNRTMEKFPGPLACVQFTRDSNCGRGIEFPTEDGLKLAVYRNCNATAQRTIEYLLEACEAQHIPIASILVLTDDALPPSLILPTHTFVGGAKIPIVHSGMLQEEVSLKTRSLLPDIQPISREIRKYYEYQVCGEAAMFLGNQYSAHGQQIGRLRKATGRPTQFLGE